MTRFVKIDNLFWPDSLRVSQFNLFYLLTNQKNLNSILSIAGWWVKWIGLEVYLIKRIQFIFLFFYESKLDYSCN